MPGRRRAAASAARERLDRARLAAQLPQRPTAAGPGPAGPPTADPASLRLAQDHTTFPADVPADLPADRSEPAAVIGRPGVREFVFVAVQPGRTDINAALARPWEEAAGVDRFHASVRIAPTHLLRGFSGDQMQAHADRLAQADRPCWTGSLTCARPGHRSPTRGSALPAWRWR